MEKVRFIEMFKEKTKRLTIETLRILKSLDQTTEVRIITQQLIKSSASVAANYRATCRARSKAEFFSKISIVVEEADETLFWLEILEESGMVPKSQVKDLKRETIEILSVVSRARKTASSSRPDRTV